MGNKREYQEALKYATTGHYWNYANKAQIIADETKKSEKSLSTGNSSL